MQHGGMLPPLGSATTACTFDSAPLHRLRSNGDVSVVQTRRPSALFRFFRIRSLRGRPPRGSNLFRTTSGRKQFGPLTASSAHTMEKLHRLTTVGGKVFDASGPFKQAH